MVQNKKTVRIKSSFFTYLIVFIICGIWSVNANSIHVYKFWINIISLTNDFTFWKSIFF